MRDRLQLHTMKQHRMPVLGLPLALIGIVLAIALAFAPTPSGDFDISVAEAAGEGSISSVTFQYNDFGFGSPVEITLQRDPGKAHFAPGGDDNHGPISVGDGEQFTVHADSGENRVGSKVELNLVVSSTKVLIKVHTSCSKPIGVGFLYGPDGDDSAEDASEFAPGGSLTAGLEIKALEFSGTGGINQCIKPPVETNTPTNTPPHVHTPTPTNTPPHVHTPTPTPTPTHVHTPTNTPTHVHTPTNTPTHVHTPTNTPTNTPTHTPTNTPTHTPTSEPTETPTPTRTSEVLATVVGPTPTKAPPDLKGDVNCDGKINSRDALMILQLGAGLKNILPCIQNADVNWDGRINSKDAALILQYHAGLLDQLPPA